MQRVVGRADQQRNAKDRVVNKESVRTFTVIAQALAMIAHGNDHRPIEQAAPVEEVSDPADLRIDERDLAEVGPVRKFSAVGFWRVVR